MPGYELGSGELETGYKLLRRKVMLGNAEVVVVATVRAKKMYLVSIGRD